ncbi:SpoIVB peptidase S55 domain-containing protein [Pelosinus sp. sgz500959]|uniref:SpoIVB peptidase S55 domain-containing protein n=1 Tax=Pelosinus sp. sgz500959 TaxID=3242472 RepID=UPI0036710C30
MFRQCRLALLVFLLVLPVSLGQAATEFMPVDEIKPGMQGIGKTVVSGTKLEEFGVEILGIMENKGATGDLILVRTYGDVIDRTGGIAQGMSGSPVYINNKLIGAVAYGWALTDHKIGMVTPIGDMLKLWDMPDRYNSSTVEKTPVPGFEELATPIMVSGFSEHALTMLQDKLKPLNLAPYGVGESPSTIKFDPLEPGSAVGVELVRGDVSVGALGTVTYIEGDKVLAFGHPFLKKGNVGYFMTNAYIFTTINGLENSFKVGTVGEAVGIINQDRGSGIAGKVDQYPAVVPISMEVEDKGTGKKQEAAVQVVQDEQLFPALSATTLFNVIDKTIDRTGSGTAKVSFEISARNMPGEVIKRDNMFYSPANIGEAAVAEFFDAMSMLASNQYNPVDIMDVKVNVSVDDERRTADIVEAHTKNITAKPGETIDISVNLKPFRGETITRVVPFKIPVDQPEGSLTLEVRGGGMVPVLQLLAKNQVIDEELITLNKSKDKNKKFADVVSDFLARDRNNDIVVEIFDMDIADIIGDATKQPKKHTNENKKQDNNADKKSDTSVKKDTKVKRKNSLATDYLISGDTQIVINVEKNK